MFLAQLVVEEDPVLLSELLPGREIGAEMVIEIEIEIEIGTVIENGTEIKTDIGTKTHAVDETIIGNLNDISAKVVTRGLMIGTMCPNRAEGVHAVVAVVTAAAEAEAAGGRGAKIGIMRKVGPTAGVPALSENMGAVDESEVEAEAEAVTDMKGQGDIGAGVAIVTGIETETGIVIVIENVTVTVTATAIVTVTVTVTVIVIVTVTVIVTAIARGIGIAGESQMLLHGRGVEVESQEGSLLVGTRALKALHMALMQVNYKAIPFMKTVDLQGAISTLYRSVTVP
jgi:hypothetical protein